MLKNLKKKDTKADPKKDTKKEKQSKNDTKKNKEEDEEEINEALVELNYDQKDTLNVKNTKKVQSYKLEEKQIDTANIVIEKKEEKKQITSWVVDEKDISKVFRAEFDAKKVETEFESLTDQKVNQELKEKAKKETQIKPVVQEKGGFKFAVLDTDKTKNVEPELALRKPGEGIQVTPQIGGVAINPPTFINSSNKNNFVPLQKTAQQLREEQIERKMQAKTLEPVVTAKGKAGGWLGSKQSEVKTTETPQQFKVSGWVAKGVEAESSSGLKFAPIQKSQQEKRFQRQQQQYKFVSKKQQEQRRLKREEEAKKGVATTTTAPKQ